MELTVDQALLQAIAAHKEGRFEYAERLYREILLAKPTHPDANHNLGLLAVSVGKPAEALPLFRQALAANPKVSQFWLSLIDGLIRLGHLDEAMQAVTDAKQNGLTTQDLHIFDEQLKRSSSEDKAKVKSGLTLSEKRKRAAQKKKRKIVNAADNPETVGPPQNQLNQLMEHYQSGRFDDAELLAVSITELFPKHHFSWKVLGAILAQTNRVTESLAALRKSVKLMPADPQTHNNLGNSLKRLGRFEEAESSYKEAIALKPSFFGAHNNLGITLQNQGRLDEARSSYMQAVALKPDFAEAHYNLGVTLQNLDRVDEAVESYLRAIEKKPEYAEAHYNLGITFKSMGRLDDSEASYRRAIESRPKYAEAHCNLGVTLRDLGRHDEAEASYKIALELKPDYAEAHYNLGVLLQELGRFRDAEVSYSQTIASNPHHAEAHRMVSTLKTFPAKDDQFLQMLDLYRDQNLSAEDRCSLCFALAKASEDIRDFAAAFRYYSEGNGLRRTQLRYDQSRDADFFRRLKLHSAALAEYSLQPENVTSAVVPIFIVGMPRSGTTLVEQIIASHSLIVGCGELPFAERYGLELATGLSQSNERALREFREKYLSALKNRSGEHALSTDKTPQNFQFIGLIAAAFPEAMIIHVKRSPAAVCWSNYEKYFADKKLAYAYSLDDILRYYNLYQDLMEFWHRSLPGRIYDMSYKELTVDQEEETLRIIEYLGVAMESSCLSPEDNKRSVSSASNVQVRRKVYRGSSEQWKRYQPYLNGLLDQLSA